jgi:arylesterase/paraoxonase
MAVISMKILKRILAALGILILVGGVLTAVILGRGGAFKTLTPAFAGSCTALPLEGSGEDILVDHERGIAYLSLLDRKGLIGGKDVQGTVARVDLNRRPWAAENALASQPDKFRPHGMSLYIAPDGSRHLFVINHGQKRGVDPEAVEIFTESAPGEFTHRESVAAPELLSPNDLVAVGPRQFYVANDKVLGGGLAAGLQQFGVGASPLTWFDGRSARYVLDDIASGGGINRSADGRMLYVAETAGKRVRVLERNEAGDVTERQRIAVDTSPDNIDVAPDGSLWVAGHANTLQLIQHFVSGAPAPTQVWRVAADGTSAPEQIYLDDGSQMSAGSVGATYGQLLLLGSITERKIQICEMAG